MASRSLNILGPILADGGNAGVQARACIPRRLHGKNLVRQQSKVIAKPPVAKSIVVRVAIYHARHNRAAGVALGMHGSAIRRANIRRPPDSNDAIAFEQNCAVIERRAARRVDETVSG